MIKIENFAELEASARKHPMKLISDLEKKLDKMSGNTVLATMNELNAGSGGDHSKPLTSFE